MINNFKKRGFTLIELLLYIGVTAVIITGIFSFMSLMMQSKVKSLAISEVEEQGMYISEIIRNKIINANDVVSPVRGSNSDHIVLSGENNNSIDIFLENNKLYLSESNNSQISLNSNKILISNFLIFNLSKNDNQNILKFQFDIEYLNLENRNEYDYKKNFSSSVSTRY